LLVAHDVLLAAGHLLNHRHLLGLLHELHDLAVDGDHLAPLELLLLRRQLGRFAG
jgi:hypothetical protein